MAQAFLAGENKHARQLVVIAVAFQAAYFLYALNLPLFGDAIASVSKPARAIFESNLTRPWNYPDADPGHPTLFPFLIAILWKIFGLKLWVPHLLTALFTAGTALLLVLQINKSAPRAAMPGLVLLCISPLFVSQSVSVSLQTPLTFFFMASWAAISHQKIRWLYLTLPAMLLTHLQGVLLLPVLGALQLFYYRNDNPLHISRWLPYLFAGAVLSIWFWAHYATFGWITASPNYERGMPDMTALLLNLLRSGWRVIDFGYILLWIPLLILTYRKQPLILKNELLLFAFIFTLPLAALFTYPPAHRYFLPLLYWLPFAFAASLSFFNKKTRTAWYVTAIAVLISGHLWVYPGKCAGDANVAYLGWFSIENEIQKALPEKEIYTYAPLANEPVFTRLKEEKLMFHSLYNRNLTDVPFVLRSNMNCEFTREQLDSLTHWPCRVWKKGGIYARVYANPSFDIPTGFGMIEESKTEKWWRELKMNFR